jgi:hypothetical protein
MSFFERLELIVKKLDELDATYDLSHVREGSLMIAVATPGKRWEIEVMRDGSLEVEVFVSTGVTKPADLHSLYEEFV